MIAIQVQLGVGWTEPGLMVLYVAAGYKTNMVVSREFRFTNCLQFLQEGSSSLQEQELMTSGFSLKYLHDALPHMYMCNNHNTPQTAVPSASTLVVTVMAPGIYYSFEVSYMYYCCSVCVSYVCIT